MNLKQAGGKAEQTIRQIEKAILRYEEITGFADFGTFNQKTAQRFKEELAKQSLAKATIFTIVRALKRFFGWLALQPGYKRKISLTDVDFLSLSDKDVRAAKAPADKAYPTLEQIKRVLNAMSNGTGIEKRDRAVIAFTAITGIRDGALVSLKLKHFDADRMLVLQNPREVSTKFSKRIDTFLFPLGDDLEAIVLDWVGYLRKDQLFSDHDPLFPKPEMGHDENDCFVVAGLSREHWASASKIREIFKAAFESAGLPNYTPHSFRHMIVSEAYRKKLPANELKAWSQNLGHEGLLTTLTSYGKLSVEEQGQLVRKPDHAGEEKPLTRSDLETMFRQRGL